jgi:glycosyltransferase involved in cell wall biosynthesis
LLSEHRKLSPKTFISLFQEWLSLKLIKSCQAKIMVINQQTGQILEEKGFAKDQIFLTKCPVSSHEIKPVETKKKRYLLSFCGRMVAQKGIYDFLDVVENLAQNGYTEPSIMIGSGPEIDKLKKQASLRNLNIVFTGFVTETQKFTYLSLSKLFCFPSYEEGWGIVITEAFSVGIPVFAYKLPIYKEIFYPHIQTTDKGSITKLSESILDYLQTMQPTKVLTNGDTLVDFTKQFSSFTIAQNESRFILKG